MDDNKKGGSLQPCTPRPPWGSGKGSLRAWRSAWGPWPPRSTPWRWGRSAPWRTTPPRPWGGSLGSS